jgi:hypothetical protein
MSALLNESASVDGSAVNPRTFRLGAEARRTNYILSVGVASLWLFAVWSLVTLFEGGLGGVELVSLLLLGAMSLVAPVVIWSLLSDAAGVYEVSDEALSYSSLGGLTARYPWAAVTAVRVPQDEPADADLDSPELETGSLRYVEIAEAQRSGSLAQLLHTVSHGRRLPIPAGVEERAALEEQILRRANADVRTTHDGAEALKSIIEEK